VAKKVKIDLLDIDINEENGASHRDRLGENDVPDALEDQAVHAERTGLIYVLMRRLKTAKLKHWLILVVSVLVITVAGGSIWLLSGGERKKESAVKEGESLIKAIPAGEKMILFDNFVVDVRDKKGDMRIALYDIVIELAKPQAAGAEGERVDLRSAIHAVLKRKQVVDGLSPEGRNLIKIELINELDRLLGEKSVKNIYITHFEVI
jgi:flagellar FliL protein